MSTWWWLSAKHIIHSKIRLYWQDLVFNIIILTVMKWYSHLLPLFTNSLIKSCYFFSYFARDIHQDSKVVAHIKLFFLFTVPSPKDWSNWLYILMQVTQIWWFINILLKDIVKFFLVFSGLENTWSDIGLPPAFLQIQNINIYCQFLSFLSIEVMNGPISLCKSGLLLLHLLLLWLKKSFLC